MVEIMIVVVIIGLLLAIAMPNFIKTRQLAQSRTCMNNLRQIEAAKQMWGVEKGKTGTDQPTDADLVGPNLYLKEKPMCPSGGMYFYNQISQAPTCTMPDHTYVY